MRDPALERTHIFMGSLIRDLAINVLSGTAVSLTGFALQKLRQHRIHRRNQVTSATDTNTSE